MLEVNICSNDLLVDAEATRAAYQSVTPWKCECAGCRNFRLSREAAFDQSALDFFDQFGIDTHKPAEVYDCGNSRSSPDLFQYGGWFHCIGELRNEDGDIVPLNSKLRVYFVSAPQLVPHSFDGRPVVQVEFEALLPWVIDEPWWASLRKAGGEPLDEKTIERIRKSIESGRRAKND